MILICPRLRAKGLALAAHPARSHQWRKVGFLSSCFRPTGKDKAGLASKRSARPCSVKYTELSATRFKGLWKD
jgi:hypothetical protein